MTIPDSRPQGVAERCRPGRAPCEPSDRTVGTSLEYEIAVRTEGSEVHAIQPWPILCIRGVAGCEIDQLERVGGTEHRDALVGRHPERGAIAFHPQGRGGSVHAFRWTPRRPASRSRALRDSRGSAYEDCSGDDRRRLLRSTETHGESPGQRVRVGCKRYGNVAAPGGVPTPPWQCGLWLSRHAPDPADQ